MAKRLNDSPVYRCLVDALWLVLLIGIPVTSFPPLAEAIGGVTVSPFSLLPLILLLPIFLIPDLNKGGRLPGLLWPILLFGLAVILSVGIAFFLPLEPFKGETILERSLHAGATLAVGYGFYFVSSRYPAGDKRLRLTLWGITIGGLLALIWATFQADYILRGVNNVPRELNELHRIISIRDLERNRVTGLAFEPSWFGDQLVILYLPLWVSAIIQRRSLLPWRKGVLSIELVLSLWAVGLLLLTRSRLSIGALLLASGFGLLFLLWWFSDFIGRWLRSRSPGTIRNPKWLLRGIMLVVALLVTLSAAYSLLKIGAELDWRMRRIMNLPAELPAIRTEYPYSVPYEVANRFAFAERVVYWRASLQAFNEHPLFGVGLGNAGLLFDEGVPAYGFELVEIRTFLDPSLPNFPNPKNLWIRLLSETGVIGTSFYLTWLALLVVSAWRMVSLNDQFSGWLALAGVISIGMQLIEGFSLDSFALPQLWVMNGLLTTIILRRTAGASDGFIDQPTSQAVSMRMGQLGTYREVGT